MFPKSPVDFIARSFLEHHKSRLTLAVSGFVGLLEDRLFWTRLSCSEPYALEQFFNTYSILTRTICNVAFTLKAQYSYNDEHLNYSLSLLCYYIDIVAMFLSDLVIPLDYFMQGIAASTPIDNDPRLIATSFIITTITARAIRLASMAAPGFWTN
jgi:hypothetical protein